MKVERTELPCLYLREAGAGGRVAYLPAAVDRLHARSGQPDHAALLAALVRWVARDDLPVRVSGPGLLDVHAYTQEHDGGRVIVHLVSLTHAGAWRAPVDELTPVGEQRVTVGLAPGRAARRARLLVAGGEAALEPGDGAVTAVVPGVLDHEVVVVELEAPSPAV
jgi:hypothetical protein